MSVVGLIRRIGSRATLYRGTPVTAADGNRALGAPWSVVDDDVGIMIQPIGDALAQKIFGTPEVIRDRGFMALEPTINTVTDRLVITRGPRAGQTYRIEEGQPWEHGTRLDHREVALVASTEVIP